MAHTNKKLRIITYNCRFVKNSINDVKALCLQNNIIFLQEHWLLSFELTFLSSIYDGFGFIGASSVDTSFDIHVGHPYGGTAIL